MGSNMGQIHFFKRGTWYIPNLNQLYLCNANDFKNEVDYAWLSIILVSTPRLVDVFIQVVW